VSSSKYLWKPIERLTDAERAIDLSVMDPVYQEWRRVSERLVESSPGVLERFGEQLVRSLSIETGILERLYVLDRGTTEALVAGGFVESLVSRSSTDMEPARLIEILRDQEAGIELVKDCVAGQRRLTKGFIHELHAILTRHQDTTVAVDQFGNRLQIPLRRGQFKKRPNNPRRPDGILHEYCPPVQVDSEVDNLLAWLDEVEDQDPILVTAWFHHRFTQIHPYQDGNGRVGRALATLIMLRAGLLPPVIDRDMSAAYLAALESADRGRLQPLVRLFARLARAAILRACSMDTSIRGGAQSTIRSSSRSSRKTGRRLTIAARRQAKELAAALRSLPTRP
jgi:hypothetical protein